MRLMCEVRVTGGKLSFALSRALEPDNVYPGALTVTVSSSESELIYRAVGSGIKALRELRSVLNDILRCVEAAYNTLYEIE